MARITVSGNTALVTDAVLGGTPNAALKAWFDFAKGQKSVIATTQHGITAIEVNSEDITVDPLLLALSQGFTVEGAPMWIKMTPEQYEGSTPEGIRHAGLWSEWHDENHSHILASDDDMLVPGNSFDSELTSDELLILLGNGYTLLLNHEIQQHLPVQEIL